MTEPLVPEWSWTLFRNWIYTFDSMVPSDRLSAIMLPLATVIFIAMILPLMLIEMWYKFGKGLQEMAKS